MRWGRTRTLVFDPSDAVCSAESEPERTCSTTSTDAPGPTSSTIRLAAAPMVRYV